MDTFQERLTCMGIQFDTPADQDIDYTMAMLRRDVQGTGCGLADDQLVKVNSFGPYEVNTSSVH